MSLTIQASPTGFAISSGGSQALAFDVPAGHCTAGTWTAATPPSHVPWAIGLGGVVSSTLTLDSASTTESSTGGTLSADQIAAINAVGVTGGVLAGLFSVTGESNSSAVVQITLTDWVDGGDPGGPGGPGGDPNGGVLGFLPFFGLIGSAIPPPDGSALRYVLRAELLRDIAAAALDAETLRAELLADRLRAERLE